LGDHVDEDDLTKREVIDSLGRAQLTNHVNESGLYALILSSTLPSAKVFKRWVTSEVLPAIRKTGKYAAKDPFKAGQTGIYNELELDKFARLANLADMTRLERVPAVRALMAGKLPKAQQKLYLICGSLRKRRICRCQQTRHCLTD
jgi:prophage antirepressor-like protein